MVHDMALHQGSASVSAHGTKRCGYIQLLVRETHLPWVYIQFFLNFVQAATVYTIYVCVTLIVFTVRAANSTDGDIDPQRIVIIALCVCFLPLFREDLLSTALY
jgi:hypothetical protein